VVDVHHLFHSNINLHHEWKSAKNGLGIIKTPTLTEQGNIHFGNKSFEKHNGNRCQ
jgi:hypothetical protein